MAKKNKNQHINLNNGPLKSVTIGEIKEKKHGFIGVLFIFLLFIGLVFFLPEIQKYYEANFAPKPSDEIVVPSDNSEQKQEPEEKEEEETKYLLSETKQFSMEDIEVNDISYNDGQLSFKVHNKTDNTINLTEKKLYFLTFDESDILLNHVPIDGSLNINQDRTFTYNIKSNAHSFIIKQMSEDDYPIFEINEDSSGISKLVCTKNSDSITYTFTSGELTKIDHLANYSKDNSSYESLYSTYNNLVTNYGNKTGITASLTTDDTSMNYHMVIDYTSFNESLDYKYYLAKNSNQITVNFILESDLFNCA